MPDLVSIITPMYNSEKFIDATIQSVQSQTYQNWEMIIVDDASTDRSIEIVKKIMSNEPRIQLKQLVDNLGPAHTRNNGIKLAKGRFLAFLDSDDLWHKDKLEKQIKFMQKNEYAFTFTGYEKIDEKGKKIGNILPFKGQVTYHDLLKSNHIGCLTAMIDLKILGYKMYMPDIKKRQDQGLWLEILKEIDKAYCLNKVLGKYRIRKDSISINKIANIKFQWQLYRELEKLSIIQSFYYMLWYAFYGIRKYSNLF